MGRGKNSKKWNLGASEEGWETETKYRVLSNRYSLFLVDSKEEALGKLEKAFSKTFKCPLKISFKRSLHGSLDWLCLNLNEKSYTYDVCLYSFGDLTNKKVLSIALYKENMSPHLEEILLNHYLSEVFEEGDRIK